MKRLLLCFIFLLIGTYLIGQVISEVRLTPYSSTYFTGEKIKIYWSYRDIPSSSSVKLTLWREGSPRRICKIDQNVPISRGNSGYSWTIPASCTNPDSGKSEDLTIGRFRIRIRWQGHKAWGESGFFVVKKRQAEVPKYEFFIAYPQKLIKGQKATLRWSIPGATGGSLEFNGTRVSVSLPAGSMDVFPANTTTYKLIFKRDGREAIKKTTIRVVSVAYKPKLHSVYHQTLPDLVVEKFNYEKYNTLGHVFLVTIKNLNHKFAPVSSEQKFFIKIEIKCIGIDSTFDSVCQSLFYSPLVKILKVCAEEGALFFRNYNCEGLKELSQKGEATFYIPFKDMPYSFRSKVTVDSENDIKESNENNNSKTWSTEK